MPWQHEKGQMLEDIKGVIRSRKSPFFLFRFAIALSDLRLTASDCPFVIFQHLSYFVLPWHCLSCNLPLLIAPFLSSNILAKRKRTNVGRYQRGNQKPKIAGQTIPWQREKEQMLEDIKGVIRSANRRYLPTFVLFCFAIAVSVL
jgi:hypothetical protein